RTNMHRVLTTTVTSGWPWTRLLSTRVTTHGSPRPERVRPRARNLKARGAILRGRDRGFERLDAVESGSETELQVLDRRRDASGKALHLRRPSEIGHQVRVADDGQPLISLKSHLHIA